MIIKDDNIYTVLETFFEICSLCEQTEKEIFASDYDEIQYLLLDNTLTDYLYILDILGFDINIEELENKNKIKVSFNGDLIKETIIHKKDKNDSI